MGNTESSVVRAVSGSGSQMCPALKRRCGELDHVRNRILTKEEQDRFDTIKHEMERILYLLAQEKKGTLDETGKGELNAWNTDTYDQWKAQCQTKAIYKNPDSDHIPFIHKQEVVDHELFDDRRPMMCARLRPIDDKITKVDNKSLQYDMGF